MCLVGKKNCYSCVKSCDMKRDCPMMNAQERENSQEHTSAPNPDSPKKICFYALHSRGDQEQSPMLSLVCYKCFP